ncbi:MAG: radical SAM family heme chaperone HemW [Bacteroidota bacterium]|nr:coproporphyrinogen III oxidase [Odoribacter sp.]MDP3642266.1 radical SAM family heme chaperone HemW [Bacteroidota bacterium]
MSGIYIHIPFCRKRCHYCDFFKTTDLSQKVRLLAGLKRELESRASEMASEEINTIYLGGGTPSVLLIDEQHDLLKTICQNYLVSGDAEITLEANPDDLSQTILSALKGIGFNRLSMGVQSFSEADLKLMNRRHSVVQAIQSVKWAKKTGFANISIDLIYGLPDQTLEEWERNVRIAVELDVQHISAYNLTYHEGTVFYDRLKKGILKELPDEISLQQFEILIRILKEAGFEHYEISNFCKPGLYSQHNSSYWKSKKYLGIGPSAHSFDFNSRRWNVSSIENYLHGIENNQSYSETEILTEQDRYNDYIITGLRTVWGISEELIRTEFSASCLFHFLKIRDKYLNSGHVNCTSGTVCLSPVGLFISDKIMEDFMFVSNHSSYKSIS